MQTTTVKFKMCLSRCQAWGGKELRILQEEVDTGGGTDGGILYI